MNVRRLISTAAAIALAAAATPAFAGELYAFSSDAGLNTPAQGMVRAFDWDGGDADPWGDAGTLEAAMNYAANKQGNFAKSSGGRFKKNSVNVFIVDFTGNSTYGEAGVTVFVMWGNANQPDGPFSGEVDVSPRVEEGTDGDFTAGVAEIFALGDGVEIQGGNLTIDVDVNGESTPVGYAITNFRDYPGQRINQQFTLAGAIRRLRLLGADQGKVWEGPDDDGSGEIFTDGLVLIVPAPPAAAWGLAGLAGLALVSRRRFTRGA
jgi:MYXO-CTERM domain-containing protein